MEAELKKLKDEENNIQVDLNIEDEIKKYEIKYQKDLKKFENDLEIQYESKKNELNEDFEKKKLEFEKDFMIEKERQKEQELKEKRLNEENILRSTKNRLNQQNQAKLENYKSTLIKEYKEKLDKQKEELMESLKSDLTIVKSNFETTKNFFEQQKIIFQAEQSATNASTFLEKMKYIIENKGDIFKNLLEQNYLILKKKMKECGEIKELDNLLNKDVIMQKISGIINMIFFINIYETLYNDLINEKNLLGKYLDELIQKCDALISTLNSEKKIQLSNLVSKPNFY